MSIRETLIDFMREEAYKPMNSSELEKIFDVKKSGIKGFKNLLKDMELEGLIVQNRTEHYGVTERMGLVVGKLQGHAKGFGFVMSEEERPDIFIPATFMSGAMNGDKVIAKVTREENGGKKCEGEIIRILTRANKTIIGTYEDSKNFGFVVADDVRIQQDVFVPKSMRGKANSKDVVIVEITQWPENRRNPEGKIIEILGRKEDKGVDILTVIKKHKLPEEFPQAVLDFAEKIPEIVPEEEYENRRDLRNIKMVTIDGEDAKDLDDAVSLEILENGNYHLGVHIADVSHYVREKNPLDNEALERATSVYLIDRVIPMLPKKLSNGVCSLNPKVDRLALSCFMEIDKTGKVVDHEIFESVIKTNERMTYTDVTKILRDKDEATIKKYEYLYDDFKAMNELFEILNKRRLQRGAIDFDFQESKIILNENGKPIDIQPYERAVANKIIEEFMLICNETVAEHMFWLKLPFVYRVHEAPDTEKLEHFNEFVHNLGYVIKWGSEVHPKELQKIIEEVKGKKEETVVSTLLLRSLKQARYSPECVGHFGLAAKYYCHFTSPIRRYPDLMIHRIIKEHLHGKIDEKRNKKLIGIVDYASVQSSEMERVAQQAEREVDDLKKAEYMLDKIGEEYSGIISSVTNFGIFIELPNTIEGLVHISDLSDDYYVFDDKHLCLIGERGKKIYRLGDEVNIRVEKIDMASHEIYFAIVEKNEKSVEEIKKIVDKKINLSELEGLEEDNNEDLQVEVVHPASRNKDIDEAYKPENKED